MSHKLAKIQFLRQNKVKSVVKKRVRGFLEAASLSKDRIAQMQARALILEAHHTTHIEGTHLSLNQSEKIMAGEKISNVDAEDQTPFVLRNLYCNGSLSGLFNLF